MMEFLLLGLGLLIIILLSLVFSYRNEKKDSDKLILELFTSREWYRKEMKSGNETIAVLSNEKAELQDKLARVTVGREIGY